MKLQKQRYQPLQISKKPIKKAPVYPKKSLLDCGFIKNDLLSTTTMTTTTSSGYLTPTPLHRLHIGKSKIISDCNEEDDNIISENDKDCIQCDALVVEENAKKCDIEGCFSYICNNCYGLLDIWICNVCKSESREIKRIDKNDIDTNQNKNTNLLLKSLEDDDMDSKDSENSNDSGDDFYSSDSDPENINTSHRVEKERKRMKKENEEYVDDLDIKSVNSESDFESDSDLSE
jgi:hypothetical protein